jgi:AraC family transcriptional activator of pobA
MARCDGKLVRIERSGREATMDGVADYPNFVLYGEADPGPYPDLLHCESISARSRIHNWRFRAHRHHDLYQFFWVATGAGRAMIDGVHHDLMPATAMLIPPLVVHGFAFDSHTEGWVVSVARAAVEVSLRGSAWVRDHLGEAVVLERRLTAPGRADVEAIFALISSEHGGTRAGRATALIGLTGLLATWFARTIAAAGDVGHGEAGRSTLLVRRFQEQVEARFRSERRLAVYAAELDITPTHLSRVCRDIVGKPASALIQDRLLQEAMRNLAYTSIAVHDIAAALGFADPAHFSKFFTQRVGRTPSVFRRGCIVMGAGAPPPAIRRAAGAGAG